MNTKKILTALFAGVLGAAVMSVSAMAAGDMNEDTANAVAKLGEEYYSTVQLAIDDAADGNTITVLKDVAEIPQPKDANITFEAAEGVKVTGRLYLPETEIDGSVTYVGFDFTETPDWAIYQWGNGQEQLEKLTLVFDECKFGKRGICIGWQDGRTNWNLKKLILDTCTAADAKEAFSLQYVSEVEIINCDFSNATDRIINVSAASGNVTVTGTDFGAGSIQLSQNVGEEARSLTVEDCVFAGEKAVVLHENLTGAGTKLEEVLLIDNTVEETTELINFKDDTVDGAAYLTENVESIVALGNETTEGNAVTEVTDGYTPASPVATVDGVYYTSIKDAITAADALEGDKAVINLLEGTFENVTITLPSYVDNVTFKGADNYATILKDSSVGHSGGQSASMTNITFDGIVFENSAIGLTAIYENTKIENMTITNCKFLNIIGKTAVSINTNSLPNLVGFTFTNNVIDNVSGGSFSGLVLRAAPAGDIVVTDNDISNVAWNAVQIAGLTADANVTITGNTMSSGADEGVLNLYNAKAGITLANNTIETAEGQPALAYFDSVVIGDKYYASLEAALNAAKDGDTITLPAGTYNAFTVPADKNNLTIVGETDEDGNNLVTITTLPTGEYVRNGFAVNGYCVHAKAETVTFKNLDFTAGTVTGAMWYFASITSGHDDYDKNVSAPNNLKNLTVENCNFTGSGSHYAIWVNDGNVTVKESSISGYKLGIDNYAIGAEEKVIISNTTFTDVYNAFHTGEAKAGSKIIVTYSTIDSDVIDVGGAVAVSIAESVISNATVTAYSSSSISITESALYDTAFATNGDNSSVALSAVYANNLNELAAAAKDASGVTFTSYYPSEQALEDENAVPVAVPTVSDYINVVFEEVTTDVPEGEKLYNINLVGANEEVINRLNSADLTFEISNTTGKTEFEIIASNEEVAVAPVNNSTVRYEFHYDGKDGVKTDTANVITIGQVKFTGYGTYTFAVDTDVDTNVAHATTIADNIVDTFVPDGDTTTTTEGELVIDNAVIDATILVPTRKLTINVAFPNSIENNAEYTYQQMKVTVSGGDLDEALVIELGSTYNIPAVAEIYTDKTGCTATASFADGAYEVVVDKLLTSNYTYNVEVSGAGYRTARYTVTMNEDVEAKTLNFWNNVKDNAFNVEEGKDSSAKTVTYLAGDIVKDGTINVYDLSAVVSYFGEVQLVEDNKTTYAKYDLDRNGKIDSKDVAYVLASWGN